MRRPVSHPRRLLLCSILGAGALALVSPAVAALDEHYVPVRHTVSAERLGAWSGQIRDRVFARSARSLAASRLALAYGGPYTTRTGEKVSVYASPSYAPNDAANAALADFIVGLVHGPEVSSVMVYVAPFAEVSQICGAQADACYFPSTQQLVIPGADPPDGVPLEEIVAHEYGHHVANNRSNPPWDAGTWGTKRWATYEQICTRAATGTAFPGDEGDHYMLNPAEAVAESYRQLNDDRGLTGASLPWVIVDPSFQPDATAETLLALDVTSPWQGTTVTAWSGKFARPNARAQRTITPAADGTLVARVAAPRGATISLYDRNGALIGTSRTEVSTTVCGIAPYTVRVVGRGRGTFRVTVSQA